jgi:tetratricopeptide (TPR) repeat protein
VRNRPPRLTDWLTSLLLLGGIAVGGAPRAEGNAGIVVRDLYFGEALFHFYQQDDFTALTHLLAAQAAGRVPSHEADASLLLGGLFLSYGQHQRAAAIFEELLQGQASAAVRDRAWFYLGKVRYQRGLYQEALAALARVGGELPAALGAEMPMLVAHSHMELGQWNEAQRVLESWQAPDSWLAYARYNLGVALVRQGRVAEGAQLLDRVGLMRVDTAEQKNLRDKANLALGYAWLQANDAVSARPVLQRVRLQGPFASKALLGAGWSEALADDYRAALVPWLELVDRDLLDSAVQESFLAVPYAFGRMEVHGEAVTRYERALDSFDAEIDRLGSAIGRIRGGALVPTLLAGDRDELGRWYWQLQAVPEGDDSRYLYHLLAGHEFQEGVKNYRDLNALGRYLDRWRENLAIYADMVEAREAAFDERLPTAEARLSAVDVEALAVRRDALAARLEAAEGNRDVVALADATEREQWARLEAVRRDPQLGAAGNEALAARQRVLQGVLYWDLDRRFKERLWQTRREFAALDAGLASAGTRLAAVGEARGGEPRRFDGFAARIAGLAPRIDTLRGAIDRSLGRQEAVLVARAVSELEAQQQRLANYRVQARFALARMYDRAEAQAAAVRAPAGAP